MDMQSREQVHSQRGKTNRAVIVHAFVWGKGLHIFHPPVFSLDFISVLLKSILIHIQRAKGEPTAIERNLLGQTFFCRIHVPA